MTRNRAKKLPLLPSLKAFVFLTLIILQRSNSYGQTTLNKSTNKESLCNKSLLISPALWGISQWLPGFFSKPMHMDHKQGPFGQDQVLPALELKTLPDGRYNGVAPTTDSPIEIGEIEILIDGGYIHSKLATSLGIVEETASKDVLNNMLIVQIGEALFVHLEGKKPKSARYDNSPIILFSEKTKGFEKALSVILQRHGPNSLPRLNL